MEQMTDMRKVPGRGQNPARKVGGIPHMSAPAPTRRGTPGTTRVKILPKGMERVHPRVLPVLPVLKRHGSTLRQMSAMSPRPRARPSLTTAPRLVPAPSRVSEPGQEQAPHRAQPDPKSRDGNLIHRLGWLRKTTRTIARRGYPEPVLTRLVLFTLSNRH